MYLRVNNMRLPADMIIRYDQNSCEIRHFISLGHIMFLIRTHIKVTRRLGPDHFYFEVLLSLRTIHEIEKHPESRF